jgi:hypothetical protein
VDVRSCRSCELVWVQDRGGPEAAAEVTSKDDDAREPEVLDGTRIDLSDHVVEASAFRRAGRRLSERGSPVARPGASG